MSDEKQAVILIRTERLLHAALAAESEPAPADALEVVLLAHQLDRALRETIVEHRDQRRDLVGGHAL